MKPRYQQYSLPSLYARSARTKSAENLVHKLEDDGAVFNRMTAARLVNFLTDYTEGWTLFPTIGGHQGNAIFCDYFTATTVASNLKRCDLGHKYVLVHFMDDFTVDVFIDSLSNLLETAASNAREFLFGYDGKELGEGYAKYFEKGETT